LTTAFVEALSTAFVVPFVTVFVVPLTTALFVAALAAEPACNGTDCDPDWPTALTSSIAGCAALKRAAGTIVPTAFWAPGGKSTV
jgi:hypothetical protein